MIKRQIESALLSQLTSPKVIVLLGPRQVGKTTILRSICENEGDYLFLDGDQVEDRTMLEKHNLEVYKSIFGRHSLVFIDEAQRIKDIGLALKILHDRLPHIKVLVSGSSSLDLANTINEPLTGRKREFLMYPISWAELENHLGFLDAKKQLEKRIIYGMYPDVLNSPGEELPVLKELTQSYLYRDLLSFGRIRKPRLLNKLLQALALQLGNEVSLNELGRMLEVSKETVDTYIDLLEKAFIIFRLNPLSRNPRKEISSTRKIYFCDNGIRNAVIGNFKTLSLRNDIGALWENFLISERRKYLAYSDDYSQSYFWRTYAQQEIDYVEEKDGMIKAFEFKWNPKKKGKFSSTFKDFYNPQYVRTIHSENFQEFLQ